MTPKRLLVLLVIGLFVWSLLNLAMHEGRERRACAAAGGYDPTNRGASQCVRDGKPVPDSLWRGR